MRESDVELIKNHLIAKYVGGTRVSRRASAQRGDAGSPSRSAAKARHERRVPACCSPLGWWGERMQSKGLGGGQCRGSSGTAILRSKRNEQSVSAEGGGRTDVASFRAREVRIDPKAEPRSGEGGRSCSKVVCSCCFVLERERRAQEWRAG